MMTPQSVFLTESNDKNQKEIKGASVCQTSLSTAAPHLLQRACGEAAILARLASAHLHAFANRPDHDRGCWVGREVDSHLTLLVGSKAVHGAQALTLGPVWYV